MNDLTALQIAQAWLDLFNQRFADMQTAQEELKAIPEMIYISMDDRAERIHNAERKICRASDDIIILGQVKERAEKIAAAAAGQA